MQFRIRKEPSGSGTFTDRNKNTWNYITPKEYQQFPRNEKRICGDLRAKDSGSLDRVLISDGEGTPQIGLYEFTRKKRWYERTVGYIPAEYTEDGTFCFVRVLAVSPMKAILFPLLFLLLLAGIIMGVLWYLNRDPGPNLDEAAVAYKFEALTNTDPTSTMIPMIDEFEVFNGSHVEEALINPDGNTCYFIYSITLDDTGEELYRSGMLKPGTAIVGFDLEHVPASGEYAVTIKIEARDIDNYEQEVNGGEIKSRMIVH